MPFEAFQTQTETTTSYKLFIVGADGVEREFGMAVSCDPSERREVTPNFVIGHEPPDEPQELIAQVVRDKTLRIERIALFDMPALQAAVNPSKTVVSGAGGAVNASAVIATLSDQKVTINVVERITNSNRQTKTRVYEGCIISDWSATRNMGRGDIRVIETMTLVYRKVTETAYAG